MADLNTSQTQNIQQAGPLAGTMTLRHRQPPYPNWPTSRPGPLAKQAPSGQRPINLLRREQMVEVGYNQATAEPSACDAERYLPDQSLKGRTGFDQLETAQEAVHRPKKRL
jgi:hypothetical protein